MPERSTRNSRESMERRRFLRNATIAAGSAPVIATYLANRAYAQNLGDRCGRTGDPACGSGLACQQRGTGICLCNTAPAPPSCTDPGA